ncbi:hypothetical protein [Treponema sp.]|uniref:hypothetical protein n=1 Tax=Treponema sp. TaxID=166 RepID=UPI00388F96DC
MSVNRFFSCPYVLSDSKISAAEDYDSAGKIFLDFTLKNVSKKNIISFVISCSLIDSEGKTVLENDSCFVEKICDNIPADCERDFRLALDSYFLGCQPEAYSVDFIYLREVRFENGKRWTDPYGMYSSSVSEND